MDLTIKQQLSDKLDTFTLAELVVARAALIEVLDRALNEENMWMSTSGICWNWEMALYGRLTGVKRIFDLTSLYGATWPHSRKPGEYDPFPIPGDGVHSEWEGPNRLLRISLMRYMAKRMRDAIRRRRERIARAPQTRVA